LPRIAADSWRFQLAMPGQSSYGSGPSWSDDDVIRVPDWAIPKFDVEKRRPAPLTR
jgi:hypothetical protein